MREEASSIIHALVSRFASRSWFTMLAFIIFRTCSTRLGADTKMRVIPQPQVTSDRIRPVSVPVSKRPDALPLGRVQVRMVDVDDEDDSDGWDARGGRRKDLVHQRVVEHEHLACRPARVHAVDADGVALLWEADGIRMDQKDSERMRRNQEE